MSMADYTFLIDWDGDGGLAISSFEVDDEDWQGYGTTPPTVTRSTTRSYTGSASLQVDWVAYNPFKFDDASAGFDQGRFGHYEFSNPEDAFTFDDPDRGFDDGRFGHIELQDTTVDSPEARKKVTGLTVGRDYTLVAHVYVPSGDLAVQLGVVDVATGSLSTTTDTWEELRVSFTAAATSHTLRLIPESAPDGGEQVWLDAVQIIGPGEDITTRVFGTRGNVSFTYGRDQARSLSAITPGETSLEVDNTSRDYSPNNPSSPLRDHLGPGKPLLIHSAFDGQGYDLFRGYVDTYEIAPDRDKRSVTFGALDLLARLSQVTISTQVHASLQTGQAIGKVLDAAGWPSDARDLDAGATTIRWWWEEGTDALEAIKKIAESEGPPAFAYVDSGGNMVFRGRHHRILSSASTTVQATFRDSGTEPVFGQEMTYDIGWSDLVNEVTATVEEREPEGEQTVWDTDEIIALGEGETRTLRVEPNDPFIRAHTPVAKPTAGVSGVYDYTVRSGQVEVSLSRHSGQSTTIRIRAVGGAAMVQGMALRAMPVTVARKHQVHTSDAPSINAHGRRSYEHEMPWADLHDATSVAEMILGQRAERLPIVHITLDNGSDQRLTEILSRDLSDRIHIVETETFTDHDFFIENIDHTIGQAGTWHTVTFGCERVRSQTSPVFTFDDDSAGFDDGLFGLSGFDDADTVLVLDSSLLDQGLLGH